MESPNWSWAIPLIVSCVALLGVGVTISVQIWNFKRQLRSSHSLKIAEMRQAWINNLRDEMAVFQSHAGMPNMSDTERQNWHRAGTKVELLMNPADPDFNDLKSAMYEFLRKLNPEEKDAASDKFVTVCQGILKREWELLKSEVKKTGGN
ncbi:hypothetical protein [Salipiger sp. CCB-MM3]|uniref:hypothetical protein n=1 Tax=Salipiger sp. CCB-MM3 TaxID=1792508 RepID=UPI0012FCC301|nr:hypothetical protein [Salipiger sp. CCB-MM3]